MSLGEQIRKRRRIMGCTLQDVVDRLPPFGTTLTRAALSKYERDQSVPRSTALWAIAKALDCSLDYLLSPPALSISWLRFRKKTSLRTRTEAELKEAARQWLEASLFVNDILGKSKAEFKLGTARVASPDEAERVANNVRQTWGVGDWPIESVSSAMERSGMTVIGVDVDRGMDGLSGIADDSLPFVVVSSAVPVDRMRMNLAHEFGHIVIEQTDDVSFDERIAFRFGAALLMPAGVLAHRVGAKRNRLDLRELLLLKEEYGISVQALIRRCFDLDVISEWTYRQLNVDLRTAGWHRNEPGECAHHEGPIEIRSDVLRCIAEGLVPESTISSLFPDVAKEVDHMTSETRWEWRDFRTMTSEEKAEALRKAAELASTDYEAGGSLDGLELIDDDE